jgi:hypothetical protein
MAKARKRSTHRTAKERAIEEIYAEIPNVPDCNGSCATACGPIAMFKGEWERVVRSAGRTPRLRPGQLVCPLLSPTGKCTVYTVRPYICRLWGTTRALRCPQGCQPERWLSVDEARDILQRLDAIAGPGTDGPMGSVTSIWEGINLEPRDQRLSVIDRLTEAANARLDT